MSVTDMIRHDEALAVEADRRCSHFTLGPCHACALDQQYEALVERIEVLEAEYDKATDPDEKARIEKEAIAAHDMLMDVALDV